MQIRCPVCDYTREVNPAKIPPTAEFASCPKCRHRFRFRAVDLDAVAETSAPKPNPEHADVWDAVDSLRDRWTGNNDQEGQTPGPEAGDGERFSEDREHPPAFNRGDAAIPWENPSRLGYWQSFLRTTLWALLQPAGFFASLDRRPALLPALAYYLIFGLVQYVLNVVWAYVLGNMLRDSLIERIGEEAFARVIGSVFEHSLLTPAVLSVPFQLALQLLITAGLVHLMVRIASPQEADFTLSFKVVAYASAGLAMTAIPVAGVLIGPITFFALLLVGCRNAFRMPWPKTFLVMLPLYMLLVFVASTQYAYYISA